MAVTFHGATYSGVSGDTKPSSNLTAGDLFVETNTDKIFQWNGSAWDAVTVADGAITLAKMAVNSVDSDQYVDGSIDTVHIGANQIDGTKIAMGSDARGDVLIYDGTNYIRLGADDGKFLRSNGTGSNPSWETVTSVDITHNINVMVESFLWATGR